MVIYDSAYIYIDSATTLAEKIDKLDTIITALEDTALKAAANDDIEEYWVDDGQAKIKTTYRSAMAVINSIQAFERMRQMYINKLNGRVSRLVDSHSLRR